MHMLHLYQFQFLYGAIKSEKSNTLPIWSSLFQFLYGAIKSHISAKGNACIIQFQFLYGAIKSANRWYGR